MKKKILITGGTGFFLGSNFLKALNLNDYSVTSISRKIKKRDIKLKGVKYVYCDLANFEKIKKNLVKIMIMFLILLAMLIITIKKR